MNCHAILPSNNCVVSYAPCGCRACKDCGLLLLLGREEQGDTTTTVLGCQQCKNPIESFQFERFSTSEQQMPPSIVQYRLPNQLQHPHQQQQELSPLNRMLYQWLWVSTKGKSGLQIGAIFRMCFALIFLYDRFILSYDLDFFFNCDIGVLLPYSAMASTNNVEGNSNHNLNTEDESIEQIPITSIFQYFDISMDKFLVQLLFTVGIIQGVLLLLGIYPRIQILCLYVNIVSFQHRSINMMYDNQDMLMIVLSFYILFLPLHHWSAPQLLWKSTSRIRQKEETGTSTWPIWPFRLIQLQMCCIYTGTHCNIGLHDRMHSTIHSMPNN
jgi:hypothetical protein